MVTMNLRRVGADLVQMQRWEFAIGQYGDVQSPDNSRRNVALISSNAS
jgi:NAD(P)H-flavin reductase